MKKTYLLAVSDFALPSPRKGSIDTYSGLSLGSELGVEIHKEIQQARCRDNPSYEAEVYCSHRFTYQKYYFEVLGKIDGLIRQPELKIEEIKTGFDLQKLKRYLDNHREDHPYCLQLRTYGYIYWLRKGIVPSLNLLLVSSRNKKMIDFPVELDVPAYEQWLDRRLAELANEIDTARKRSKKRKSTSAKMTFPFVQARQGQKELIETVSTGMQQKKHLMLQAPTGLGKTIGILYPSLQESLSRGQKVIYLTPKNSQHLVAVDAIKRLQDNGAKIKSLTVTAKKKICMKQEPLCNADYCEFAENHYTKMTENKVIDRLKKEKRLQAHNFRQAAETYQVCPYELQMDLVPHVETVICDYNYVFSPRTAGSRVAKLQLGEDEKPNVIIDEAHNLPARAMDYYSPALAVSVFEKVGRSVETLPKNVIPRFHELIKECIEIIYRQADKNKKGPHFITPHVKEFTAQEAELREFLSTYLESDVTIGPNDIVLGIYNYWADFTAALEWVSDNAEVFFTSFIPDPPLIKLTCCDASDMLKACYNEFEQVVGFSATLKPFAYYSQLSGLATKKLKMEEFISPFPKQRRKLLLIPQISSKYSERHRQYPRIAEVIQKICVLKRGNYFAFFPSFDFMDKVLALFEPPWGFKVLSQSRGMKQDEIKKILACLNEKGEAHIIFAVLGGVLAEGIDYPGEQAIGAFVIGTPLPNYDWEREKMREYYEKHYAAGVNYAYVYPAMAKAVQAAGRVIRSETDKGLIVLMDNRYLQESYYQCMPQDWFNEHPNEMVSQGILQEVKTFWQSCYAEDSVSLHSSE